MEQAERMDPDDGAAAIRRSLRRVIDEMSRLIEDPNPEGIDAVSAELGEIVGDMAERYEQKFDNHGGDAAA